MKKFTVCALVGVAVALWATCYYAKSQPKVPVQVRPVQAEGKELPVKEKTRELLEREAKDMAQIRKTLNSWKGNETALERWKALDELLHERLPGGYPHWECLRTEKGKAEVRRLQAELEAPYAAGRAKAIAVLERLAKTYSFKCSTDLSLFISEATVAALEKLEKSLAGKTPKEAARMMRDAAKNVQALRSWSTEYLFLLGGYEDVMRPIAAQEFEDEYQRRLREIAARKPDVVVQHGSGWIRSVKFSPDCKSLAVVSRQGAAVYDASGKLQKRLSGLDNAVGLVWTNDKEVAGAPEYQSLGMRHKGPTRVFLDDFEWLKARSESGLELWRWKETLTVRMKDKDISSFDHSPRWGEGDIELGYGCFSKDGKYVAFAGGNGFLQVRETQTGKEVFRARSRVGLMHDEFRYKGGDMLTCLDLHATPDQLTVAVGGTGVDTPVAIYRIKLK